MISIKMNYRVVGFGGGLLFALAVVLPVFMLNKTLIWDDWIWIHSSPEQLRDIAIQLGFWWLADLNVFIYTLDDPNFFLSAIAFCSHVVSIAVLGRLFTKLDVLNDVQYAFWAACCIVTPYLLVRYINSVAFYNVWFAFFVCAAYLFVFFENKFAKLLSALLFLVSFSLNSLIPAFFLIVLFANSSFLDRVLNLLGGLTLKSTQGLTDICRLVWSRLLKVWLFVPLPFVFYAIRLLSPYAKKAEDPYEFYNVPQLDSLLLSPLLALRKTLELLFQVIWYGLFGGDSLGLLLGVAISGAVLVVLFFFRKLFDFCVMDEGVTPFGEVCRRNLILLFAFSCVLVFPYVLVGKPPVLGNLLEARHFLTAEPFVFAMAVLVISGAGHLLGKFAFGARIVTVVLLSVFVSFCVWRAVFVASTVWWENKVSNYIVDTIKRHKSDLKFWVFDNQIPEPLGVKRWNYVYTGFLISAFGTKDNFGISKGEYLEWNQPVKLLSEPYYRRRYNIEDYVHQDSYNYVVIKLLRGVSAHTIVFMYLSELVGYKNFKMMNIVSVNVFNEFGCVDEVVSFFSPDALSERRSSIAESTFCKNVVYEHCRSVRKGTQVIPLNQFEYAYAVQKYPSLLGAGGLNVFGPDTNFTHIAERCP